MDSLLYTLNIYIYHQSEDRSVAAGEELYGFVVLSQTYYLVVKSDTNCHNTVRYYSPKSPENLKE